MPSKEQIKELLFPTAKEIAQQTDKEKHQAIEVAKRLAELGPLMAVTHDLHPDEDGWFSLVTESWHTELLPETSITIEQLFYAYALDALKHLVEGISIDKTMQVSTGASSANSVVIRWNPGTLQKVINQE